MVATVKFVCDDGEIFRGQLEEPSFEAIVDLVTTCRPDVKGDVLREGPFGCAKYAMTYADEEGDLCILAPATFPDFLSLHQKTQSRMLKFTLKLPAKADGPANRSSTRSAPKMESRSGELSMNAKQDCEESRAKGKGKGGKGKHWKGTEQQDPASTQPKQDTSDAANGEHAGARGPKPCGPWRLKGLLRTLRMLKESGVLTAAKLPSFTVVWLPFLAKIAALQVEKINKMAKDGLDPCFQKMLEIIQEQAAKTPGLEHHAAVITQALSGDNDQRRLGEALLELLKALDKLGLEVQSCFSEAVAPSLLPILEEVTEWPMARKGAKGKDKRHQNPASTAKQQDLGDADAGCGPGGNGFGRWRLPGFLRTMRMLKDTGILAAMFPCLAVQSLPFLIHIAAQKVKKINGKAKEGLDPNFQKMLEIVQEQAAKTPGSEW
ncbi:unnamed protein product [Durusdinium trenchii]|uniref:ZZ-type domain-containing protein n=2 Tax=Durusdinium trenchii TaxID=1381693 RepID=A0ABP0S6D9_9DINO